jgi:hypothetical protein
MNTEEERPAPSANWPPGALAAMSAAREAVNNMILQHQKQLSLTQRLAEFFHARPGQWIDGRTLGSVAGSYGWRTRCSELRRAPFFMAIKNRQRHVRLDGRTITISEYAWVREKTIESAAAGVDASAAAV